MSAGRKWYAIYTKPRWEKKVHRLLQDRGVESYCPLNKIQRKWSDRYKIVEEPLFKSYVFVKISEEEKTQVRMINGVVNFVYWLGKPAEVKEKEIEVIRRFLNDHEFVIVEPLPLKIGQQVVIQTGVFMDYEGNVTSVNKKKIQIRLNGLGVSLVVFQGRDNIKIISGTN